MASFDDNADTQVEESNYSEQPEGIVIQESVMSNLRVTKIIKSHEIATRTIKTPPFSYAWLELISDPPSKVILEYLTVRSFLTAAFTQFLGLTGSAISVDIL